MSDFVYNPIFAKVYNQKWKGFALRVAPLIQAFFEAHVEPDRRTMLDLCCGTGQLAQYFLEQGYDVTGIDLSPAMIDYAEENNQEAIANVQARFLVGDAADYTLDAPVDLAISTYDALNHLPDMDALASCMHCTYKALKPGGWFIFDLNTRAGLMQHWQGIQVTDHEDFMLVTRGIIVEDEKRAYTRITGFLQGENGLFERFEQNAYNTIFAMADVKAAMEQAGFAHIHFANASALGVPVEDPEQLRRAFIVAQK